MLETIAASKLITIRGAIGALSGGCSLTKYGWIFGEVINIINPIADTKTILISANSSEYRRAYNPETAIKHRKTE